MRGKDKKCRFEKNKWHPLLYFVLVDRRLNSMLENRFKTKLIRELKNMFPGCIVTHLDPNEIQGIPDLLILYKDKWAALEGKKYEDASVRPNQEYYVNLMDDMSFASFIYPENKDEVLYELSRHFM
jgi:hypothetical protein